MPVGPATGAGGGLTRTAGADKITLAQALWAGVAQLVERRTRNAQVAGSIPFAGSIYFPATRR